MKRNMIRLVFVIIPFLVILRMFYYFWAGKDFSRISMSTILITSSCLIINICISRHKNKIEAECPPMYKWR